MKTKYYNDAIIGNKNVRATLSKRGEILRLYYPSIDYRQFIDEMMVGLKINDSRLINLYNDINNVYSQEYIEDTNIIKTEIKNTYFNIKIVQTDFVPMKENLLVRKYVFKNEHDIPLDVNLLVYSKLLTSKNNKISGMYKNESLIQYMHDYTMSIFSKEKPLSYQINNCDQNISDGEIGGKDYIGMSSDSSISYNIGKLQPGEEKEIEVLISIYDNKSMSMEKINDDIIRMKKLDLKKEFNDTKKYWKNYLVKHNTINLKEPKNEKEQKIHKIYKRTILLFPLLYNYETGGISAAAEVDEEREKCGGYAYSWPRDAIFITKAMNELHMNKEVEKFYKDFCKNTQSKNGMWEQRFYTDGTLAPSWGYQVDETAAVIYGIYDYYKNNQDVKFLKDNLKTCEKALKFLSKYVDNILENKEQQLSYDIWEECEDIHCYSLATILAALGNMLEIYDVVKPLFETNRLKLEQISKSEEKIKSTQRELKKYILNNFYDKEKGSFVRNKTDNKMDISLLGLVYPFNIFSPKEKKIVNTVERINMTLRTYTGGYLRYEGDNYMGGNPWVIANLWLTEYYLAAGSKTKAKEYFNFAIIGSNNHGLLPEQVDNDTMDPAWVIGLGWSHAMFITVLKKLYN